MAVALYGGFGGGSQVALLRNNSVGGLGSFLPAVTFAAGASPYKLAAGDLDGDGDPDLAVARDHQKVGVLLNSGGAFAAPASYATFGFINTDVYPTVALGDVDNDDDLDVVYGSTGLAVGTQSVTALLRNQGNGTFAAAEAIPGSSAMDFAVADVTGDVDLDGTVDLLIGAMNLAVDPNDVRVVSGSTHLMLWGKSGSQIGGGSHTVCSGGDLNSDGVPDVLVQVFVGGPLGWRVAILNGPNGANVSSFGPAVGSYGQGMDGGVDLNGDGVSEVLIGAPTESSVGRVYLYDRATRTELWHADGTALNAEFGSEVSLGGDVDGDGFGDVAVLASRDDDPSLAGPSEGAVRVLSRANGGTVWTRFGRAWEALNWAKIDFSHDLNGDGIPDVLVGAPRE